MHPTPLILLAAQSIMLGLGAIPVYWLARERFPGSVLAPLFAVLYLLYLPIREANRYGYHPGALVSPLFLFALYFMEQVAVGPDARASSRSPGSSRRTCPSPARRSGSICW